MSKSREAIEGNTLTGRIVKNSWIAITLSGYLCWPMQNLQAAEQFSDLSDSRQQDIGRLCLPVQYEKGIEAYRECVKSQVDVQIPSAEQALTQLSLDEQYAIQQYCKSSGSPESSAYQACVNQQLVAVETVDSPNLSAVPEDEQYMIQQGCFDVQSAAGASEYRQCLAASLEELLGLPEANLSILSTVERNKLQLRCSSETNDARSYRECLLIDAPPLLSAALPSPDDNSADAIQRTEINVDDSSKDNPAGATASETTAVANAPELEEAIQPAAGVNDSARRSDAPRSTANTATNATTIATTNTSPNTSPNTSNPNTETAQNSTQAAESLAQSTRADNLPNTENSNAQLDSNPTAEQLEVISVAASTDAQPFSTPDAAVENDLEQTDPTGESLSETAARMSRQMNQQGDTGPGLMALAAIGFPLLLITAWMINKRRRTARVTSTARQNQAQVPIQPYPDEYVHDTRRYDFSAFDRDSTTEFETQLVNLLDESNNGNTQTRNASTHTRQRRSDAPTAVRVAPEPFFDDTTTKQIKPFESFFSWLNVQPVDERLSFAIESLVYWTAYADDRFDPSMKKRLFKSADANPHDFIKRKALQKDTDLFRSSIRWLQKNTSSAQRVQILDLLMALLVNEESLTPTQNVLLRFIADSFGIGNTQLDEQYQSAYAQPFPPLPRVDKPEWWHSVTDEMLTRWDARALPSKQKQLQNRIRLGLPLRGKLSTDAVTIRHQRAHQRCDPRRFDLLSDREQILASRQQQRINEIRDELMEETA